MKNKNTPDRIKVLVSKKTIGSTNYFSLGGCGLAVSLRKAGFKNLDVGGMTVDIGAESFKFTNKSDDRLATAYTKKQNGLKYKSVLVTLRKIKTL